MRNTMPVLAAATALWIAPAWAGSGADPAQEILALERQAMDGWLKGDPGPELAISDSEITWFHVVAEKRVEGLAAVTELCARYRGMPLFDSYEILNPKVQAAGDVAVLTYQLAQHTGSRTSYWNGTRVYRRNKEGWRVIHAHWSAVKEQQP